MTGRLLDRFAHVVFAIEIKDVCDEVKGILVILNFGVETREVEPVGQVLFVYLTEVLVSTGRNELGGIVLLAV